LIEWAGPVIWVWEVAMPAPLSMDLRRRIVAAYEEGGASQQEVADRFDVGVASVVRLWAKHRRGESLEAKTCPRQEVPLQNALMDDFQELLDEEPDLPQWMYAESLEARTGRSVSKATVGRMLRKLGYTLKKKR